jgi:predicted XRE-type DNA-binding protein
VQGWDKHDRHDPLSISSLPGGDVSSLPWQGEVVSNANRWGLVLQSSIDAMPYLTYPAVNYPQPATNQTMNKVKRKKLAAAGWKVGSASDFLDLSAEEAAFIDLKLQLAKDLQKKRLQKHLTQTELAQLLKSSQSRVAKMEAGDPSVSMDLLVRSLLALGASKKTLQQALSR